MEVIRSKDNEEIKEYRKLQEKKYRDEKRLFLVENDHLVKEAYNASFLYKVIVLEGYDCNYPVPSITVSSEVMKSLSLLQTIPNIIGVVRKLEAPTYGKRLLILDNVQDPGNLGTIIRSACAFNIDTVILSDNSVDLFNPKVVRATQGMMFHIDIKRYPLKDFIPELKANNYMVVGTSVSKGITLKDFTFKDKLAIVVGNEGTGISDEVASLIENNIYIPMSPKTESLNVAVASSIIMYEMSKKDYE